MEVTTIAAVNRVLVFSCSLSFGFGFGGAISRRNEFASGTSRIFASGSISENAKDFLIVFHPLKSGGVDFAIMAIPRERRSPMSARGKLSGREKRKRLPESPRIGRKKKILKHTLARETEWKWPFLSLTLPILRPRVYISFAPASARRNSRFL